MKKLLFLITLIFISNSSPAQTKQVRDSLNNVIKTSKQDTAIVIALCRLTFLTPTNEIKFSLVNKAIALARKIKFEKGEAFCYSALGNHFNFIISDYPQSLKFHLKALKIREKLNDVPGIVRSLGAVGTVYAALQNNEAALAYYFKAEEVLKQINIPLEKAVIYRRIGEIYLSQNKLDSALIYFNRSYENVNAKASKFELSHTLVDLGNVHTALGNTELAFLYYRTSIAMAIESNRPTAKPGGYLGLSKLFLKTNNKDSAIYYAKQSLTTLRPGGYSALEIEPARLLAQLYKNRDDKEAVRYYEMAWEAQDSVFSGSNTAQIQSLSFSEQERQRELNESKFKEAEDRKHNLQFAAIAIGLITFIILFFALSRSIIVKTKFIEFFGVLLLLAVFEFINLFIHPYLDKATNHSPVLMLLVLIIIGAGLVPLHHKLEKWMTHVMVEKNKRIRLEAAKKTIASLEPE